MARRAHKVTKIDKKLLLVRERAERPEPEGCPGCGVPVGKNAHYCQRCGAKVNGTTTDDPRGEGWKYTLQGKTYPDSPDFGWILVYDPEGMPVWLAVRLVALGLLIQSPDNVAVRSEAEADAFQRELMAHRQTTGEKFPAAMQQKAPILDAAGRPYKRPKVVD